MNEIVEALREKIAIKQITDNKYCITFPMYRVNSQLSYEIFLISHDCEYYLSDEGTTYSALKECLNLTDPDVIKKLDNIMERYGCFYIQSTNAFACECTLHNYPVILSHLIQAISLMLNMKIFNKNEG